MIFVRRTKQAHPLFIILICSLFSSFLLSEARNIISKGQPLNDGEFLTSANDVFELGFFSIVNSSTSRYLGIRYRNIQDKAIIWMANRNKPISNTNGSMIISEDGNLIVRDGNGIGVWSTNVSNILLDDTVAVLQRTGNFILSNNGSIGVANATYWQSFKDPTDTLLPNMGISFPSSIGETRVFTSWKSETDPSAGNFTMGIDSREVIQIVIWEQSRKIWRSGPWHGLKFVVDIDDMFIYGFRLETNHDKNYLTYTPSNPYDLLRFQISWNGYVEQLRWNESENKWILIQKHPSNPCEEYNYCGKFGVCSDTNSPSCVCIDGFEPSNPGEWKRGNWSGGCVRRTLLRCQRMRESEIEEDRFNLLSSMKLPDNPDVIRTSSSLEDCKSRCLQTCSCNALAYNGGIGCMLWKNELLDVQHFEKPGSTDIYVRVANSESGGGGLTISIIAIIVIACAILLIFSGFILWKLMSVLKEKRKGSVSDMNKSIEYSTDRSGQGVLNICSSKVRGPGLPMFNFKTVAAATDNFSEENKLGQGGFGPVYKGKLPGGEEIAVKRLSKISCQGLQELKNEIKLIAKLQHRNLVRLLGYCIQGEEKILLYEHMPNKSLDCFIFDPAMQYLLDWRKRFIIIEGIARGLLYLHRDSRLRIIHRDLKASNILLDEEMNPKISDFGMAKIFGGNQNEANTNRVVGTFGYMSPEYAMEGLFSVKSDVYSFGVLLLEIVCGRRNTSFRLPDQLNLITYSWKLWNEGRTMELVDPSIASSCCEEEVLKCIQLGILCVQDSTLHRPTMQAVVSMLESNTATLPIPKQPTFTPLKTCIDSEIHADGLQVVSSNNLTITLDVGR